VAGGGRAWQNIARHVQMGRLILNNEGSKCLAMTWPAISARLLVASVASGSPRAGEGGAAPLKVKEFVGSVARLEWAKDNGCPWQPRTLRRSRSSRAPGCPEAGAGARLRMGCVDVWKGR